LSGQYDHALEIVDSLTELQTSQTIVSTEFNNQMRGFVFGE